MTDPRILVFPEAAGPLSPEAARLRRAFAQRHAPLPTTLAESLAAFLGAPKLILESFWGRAFSCMGRSLGVSRAIGDRMPTRGALDRFPLIVCEPILRRAAERAGAAPLAGWSAEAGLSEDARLAEAEVAGQIDALLADPAQMGAPFWVHAAMDLRLAAARRARGAGAPDEECDPALTAIVFLHPPRVEGDRPKARPRLKALSPSTRRRSGLKPKEGGVSGVRLGRSLEDLPDALMSEFIQPRALFADRLLHDGILTRHRPPKREPKRDLLALTLTQAGPEEALGVLVKAAWADGASRLRAILHRMGLANSDLVWAEPGGRSFALTCALEHEEEARALLARGAEGARAEMLMRSGLFPEFLRFPLEASPREIEDPRRILRGGFAALEARGRGVGVSAASEYAVRLALICKPFEQRAAPDWPSLRAECVERFGRDMGGGSRFVWLGWRRGAPRPVELLGFGDGVEDLILPAPDPHAPDPAEALALFLGRLVQWTTDAVLEAIDAA